jgi:hypothetical protein
VVVTRPDSFDVGPGFDGPVRFEFDERISESAANGLLDDAVTVSPRTGDVSVSHGRSSLSIEVDGGFRPGLVYRVTLLPVVRDLFGNQLRDPFELVFSTGGEGVETTLAGDVWDRVTGRGLAQASLHALGEDSLVHVAATDEEGIFAFRYLPAGAFQVVAFVDQNRDGELDENETQGMRDVVAASGDTVLIDLPVLDPDTTPAILMRAEMLDSVTLALEFDDYLEPSASLADVGILLESDSIAPPSVVRLLHEHEYVDFAEAVADSFARLDSIDDATRQPEPAVQADTTAADSVDIPDSTEVSQALDTIPEASDTVPALPGRQGPPRLNRARGSETAAFGRPVLPGNRIVAFLGEDPGPGVELRLTVSGVVNLNGLPGGGGETTLLTQAPAMDSVAPDGVPEAVPDAVPADPLPDTLATGAVPDTVTADAVVLGLRRWFDWRLAPWRKGR